MQTLHTLYPPIEPYQTGFLQIEENLIYWEEKLGLTFSFFLVC